MGEMADFEIDRAINEEMEAERFGNFNMELSEAYERGIIDETGSMDRETTRICENLTMPDEESLYAELRNQIRHL